MRQREGFAIALLLIIVAAAAVIAAAVVLVFNQPKASAPTTNTGVACTADAKQCPDGSYVSRVLPSCAFAACPGTNTNSNTEDRLGPGTYQHPDGLYTVQYPTAWTYRPRSGDNPSMFYDARALTQTKETELLLGSKIEIYYEDSSSKTLAEAIEQRQSDSTILSQTTITLDGQPAIRRAVRSSFGNTYINQVWTLSGGKLFILVQYIVEDDWVGEYTSAFDHFVSTFQFTDQTAAVKD